MGLIPMTALGVECYGTVTKVGSAVSEFQPGDVVFCIGPNGFGNRVQAYSGYCRKPPAGVDPVVRSSYVLFQVTSLRKQIVANRKIGLHCLNYRLSYSS